MKYIFCDQCLTILYVSSTSPGQKQSDCMLHWALITAKRAFLCFFPVPTIDRLVRRKLSNLIFVFTIHVLLLDTAHFAKMNYQKCWHEARGEQSITTQPLCAKLVVSTHSHTNALNSIERCQFLDVRTTCPFFGLFFSGWPQGKDFCDVTQKCAGKASGLLES